MNKIEHDCPYYINFCRKNIHPDYYNHCLINGNIHELKELDFKGVKWNGTKKISLSILGCDCYCTSYYIKKLFKEGFFHSYIENTSSPAPLIIRLENIRLDDDDIEELSKEESDKRYYDFFKNFLQESEKEDVDNNFFTIEKSGDDYFVNSKFPNSHISFNEYDLKKITYYIKRCNIKI